MTEIPHIPVSATFVAATPLVHCLTAFFLLKKRCSRNVSKPLSRCTALAVTGGPRAVVFQVLAWLSWSVSCCLNILPQSDSVETPRSEVFATIPAVGYIFSLLFLIKGIVAFNHARKPSEKASPLNTKDRYIGRSLKVHTLSRESQATKVVITVGALWAGLGTYLLIQTLRSSHDPIGRVVFSSLSGAAFIIGAFSTHGLGGYLRWGNHYEQDGWKFYQPFVGGTAFIATQIVGWILFSTALIGLVYVAIEASSGVVFSLQRWAMLTGATAMAAQVALAVSLAIYKGPQAMKCFGSGAAFRMADLFIMSLLYMPVHFFLALVSGTFFVLPFAYALPLWGGFLFGYYGVTSSLWDSPEYTGSREWGAFKDWLGRQLDVVLPSWLGSFEIRKDDPSQEFDPTKKYIFGYGPHAYYPVCAGIVPLTVAFKQLLPGIRPVPLAASIVFLPPLLRDIVMFCGSRVVSKASFHKALQERGHVLVVPGGQEELLQAHRIRNPTKKQFVICRKHKGFVRIAIKEQAFLVPFLVFGELDSMRNAVEWPRLERLTYRLFGFPIPFLIVGKWKVLPFPSRSGLRCVVGRPIRPPRFVGGGEEVPETLVERLHEEYYCQVEALFHRHKSGFYDDDVEFVLQ